MKTLAFVVAASAMSIAVAFAQTPPAAQPSSSANSSSASSSSGTASTVTKVENWTAEEWDAAKIEWAKDKTRWADCNQQSTDRKLTGRDSWSYLYSCMKT
jgi:serine protease inhibitor ecotin